MTTPSHSASLRWGIFATGRIAGVFARDLTTSRSGKLHAVGSRRPETAKRFADEHGIDAEHAHGSLAAFCADPEIDAVYVATPHPMHCEAVVAALEAGKHVLCEKPIAMTSVELEQMMAAASASRRTLMEAWMYRCHPQTKRVVQLVQDGAIGELRHVQAAFSFSAPYDPAGRLWNKALGGGGILDVGGYPLSYSRLLAGVSMGEGFADPTSLQAVGKLHPESGVDVQASALLHFEHDVTAEISCGTQLTQDNAVRVYGSTGWIHVPSPYIVTRDASPTTIWLHREGADEPEAVVTTPDRGTYAYEADAFAAAVTAGELEVPECPWDDTRGNLAGQLQWCNLLAKP
ncbi:MAG: hypothetical protein SynsKO_24570 [Synoicihabitans sp.]